MAKLIYEKDARGATLVNGKIYRIPATKAILTEKNTIK